MPPFEKSRIKQQYQLTKEKEDLYKLNQNKLLKLFTKANQNAISNYYLVYQRFRQAIKEKKLNKPQISSKMKGRIVLQLAKYQSNTSIAEAFIRWKVRTDPEMVKRAVDKILLNSKLNQFNAFQKLKFLVGKTNAKENRMNAKKRKNYSLLQLALFVQKKEFQLKRQALEEIKPKGQDANKMLGLLLWSISSKHRERYQREKFNWWRLVSKIKSDKFAKQLKALERLGDEYNMRNDRLNRQRLKEAFEIWRGDLVDYRLKKKFFSVLLKTTFGRLQRCYTRWVDLPDKRENDIKKQGLLLITKLCNKVDLHKRQVWNSFKDLHDDAKNKKTKVIRELIEVTFNQSYNAFYKWANYNTYAKLTETNLNKIKSLQHSAQLTHQLVKQQTYKLFNLSNKMQICTLIDKILIKIQQRLKFDALKQIENYIIQKKMQEKLNNINKTDLIKRLKETSNRTQNGLLKQVLRKFSQNHQIWQIKNKYFAKILLSVNGQLIDTFRKWKALPDPDEAQRLQQASKFQRRLQLFINSKNKQPFDCLKSIHYDAIQKKKYCIKQLFHVTMSAPQRYLKLWYNASKIYKSVIACQKTNNFFDSLAITIKSNILAFMISKSDADKKEKCIIKILSASHSNLSIAFNLWKAYCKQTRIQDQLGEEKKKFILMNLKKFVENDRNQRLRRILKIFYNELLLSQQIKKIHLKLMQTVIGKVVLSFQKWKLLPEGSIGNTAKVSKFTLSLGRVSNRFIKINSWNILEDYLLDGQAKKKFCINKIILSGHSDVKTAFLLWHRRAWEMKMFDQFSQLNVSLNDQIIKQKLINWINAGFKVKNYALVEILRRFNQFALSQNLRRKALAIIHRNTISQVWLSFNRWKQIPENDYSEFSKISKFESSLNKFSIRFIRKQAWNPLQEVYDDALAIKKRSILLLVKTQESEQQKALNNWNKNVSLIVEVDRCKSVMLLFKFIGSQIQNNLAPLNMDDSSKLKEKALKLLIQGTQSDLRYFLLRWQNVVKFEQYAQIENENTKIKIFAQLNHYLQNRRQNTWRKVLVSFKNNIKVGKLRDKFFMKLMTTTFGGAVMAFQKWKNLPTIQNKEELKRARIFETSLSIIFRGRVRQSFEPLKEEYYEGINKKLFCIRKLMILAMGQNKRLFQLWRNTTVLSKQIESCKHTNQFFTSLALTVASNVQVIFKPNKLQQSTLQRIFLNFINSQRWAFDKWLNQTKTDKIASQLDDEKKKYLLLALTRNLKHNSKGQLRDVLRFFDKARKRQNLLNMIQLKLLHTLVGQIGISFQKWKQLPDHENSQKASKFERGISKIQLAFVRKNGFSQLVNIYYEGQAKQKYYVNKLVYTCMSAQKKAFLQWNKISKASRAEERANKVFSFFNTISKVQQQNLTILIEEQVTGQKKYLELVRLLKEWEDMFKDSYQKWKQTQAKLDLLANQQRAKQKCSILEILKDYIQNKKNYKLRMILRKFYYETENQKALNKYLIAIQNTQIGKLSNSFLVWKRLPEIQKTKEACIFEKKIFQIFRKSLLFSFDSLQDLYYQALNKKRRAVLLLVKTTQSQQQQALEKWYNKIKEIKLSKQQNIDEKKKLAIQLFYQHKLNQLNVGYIEWRNKIQANKKHVESKIEREQRLKKEAIILFQNYGQIKLRLYFTKWKVRSVKQTMVQICNAIQRMISLNRFTERAIKKYVMDIWKGQPSKNKWFKRVAGTIAKNSKINKQIAYWRMRDNCINLKGVQLSTYQIIKCKKLFNNLIKVLDRIKQRAFTHLEHFGKGIGDDNSFQPSQTSFLQQTPIKEIKEEFFRSQIADDLSISRDQQTISDQQKQIQELKQKIEKMSIQKLFKSLEQLQDHLIEDGFIYIQEYSKHE